MKRILAACLVAAAGFLTGADSAAAGPSSGRVLLIALPTLTWDDLRTHDLPAIRDVLAQSAVGSLSVRAIGSRTDLEEAYATIGAGNRARGARGLEAGYAADADEPLAEGNASDVYRRRMGGGAGDASVLALQYPAIYRSNTALAYGAEVGSLGQTEVTTAVVANADLSLTADEPGEVFRPAVAAMMDRRGQVGLGTVGRSLVEEDPAAPFGVRQSIPATTAATAAAWDRADVVLVEASDLARADRWLAVASVAGWREARAEALGAADRLVASLADLADPDRDLLVLLSPNAGGRTERLTVVGARGPGMTPGALLRSTSTRRAGYVTLPDIAPTVLDHVGIEAPDSMTGGAMRSTGSKASIGDRIGDFADAGEAARFRDQWLTPFLVAYVTLHALLSVAAIVTFLRRPRRAEPWFRFPALVLLALPVSTFLLGFLPAWSWGPAGAFFALGVLAIGLAGAAYVFCRSITLGPPMVLAALGVAVVVVDLVTGSRLQLNTFFGYSPIVAGRFQGIGNQAFAVLAASTIVVAAWIVALRGATRVGLLLAGGVTAVVLIVNGAPTFGADVGGILATAPAYGVALLLLSGRRIGWQRLVALGCLAVLLLILAAGADLARPPDSRTHLGRLADDVLNDPGDLGLVLRRKAESNIGVLQKSSFSYLVPFLLAVLGALVYRPAGLMRDLTTAHPVLRPALLATLVAATLGFLLNDSGVAVPAVMLSILNPVLLYTLATLPPAGAPSFLTPNSSLPRTATAPRNRK